MRPHLQNDGTPVGQRKRHKADSPKKPKPRLPDRLYECLCDDCRMNPGCHPTTLLPGNGCWLTKKEHDKHSNEQRKRTVATTLLASLEPPSLNLPVPGEFGLLPSNPPQLQAPTTDPPIHDHSSTHSSQYLPEDLLNEAQVLLDLIKPAIDVINGQTVVFRSLPNRIKVDPSLLDQAELDELCALDQSAPTNSVILGYKDVLDRAASWINAHPVDGITNIHTRLEAKLLVRRTTQEKKHLKSLLLAEWNHQANIAQLSYSFDTAKYFKDTFRLLPPLALMAYLLAASLYLLCGLSIDHCEWTLVVLNAIIDEALSKSADIFAAHTRGSSRRDVRSVIDILDLGPQFRAYVCCPSCSQLYPFDPDQPSSCPPVCTQQDAGKTCGAKLRRIRKRNNSQYTKPIRQYQHRSMKDYAAYLHSRPDLQQYLYDDPTTRPHNPGVWDVWDAPYVRDFLGPEGFRPFTSPASPQGRLIFSLNMDGFNPFGNKEAGKKVTIGGIYMICLNLPPAIRYNIENVYLVGVIPGPKEPSLHEINYFLRPLVDELLVFWDTGVYLSRTTKYPHGWLVRCAVVPLVCDLPAARQMAGFSSHSSTHFCSICTQTNADIQNIDPTTWTLRDQTSHREAAQAWLDAPTEKDRAMCVKKHGVRWSELLRLPYWDPIRYTVIDSMHAFYLRLFNHHCRSIWGMSVKIDDGSSKIQANVALPTQDELRIGNHTLRYGSKSSLQALSVVVLRQICREIGTLSHHGKKGALVDRLLLYRIQQGWFTEKGKLIDDRPGQEEPPPPPEHILVDPRIQYFIKKNVVPSDLRLRTGYDVDDYFRNAAKTTICKLKRCDLLTLFTHKVQPALRMPVDDIDELTKEDLVSLIQAKRQEAGFIDDQEWPSSKPVPVKKTVVLGRDVLAEVRKDMTHIRFPSWMAKPPKHPGEDAWGKYSADQWKTFCLYVLPVTLIRLWGDQEDDSLERRQLDNFMHLITAVKVATMRRISEQDIVQYEHHMRSYLSTLQSLYPDAKVTPYQHLALHFGSFLRGFGPTHPWRCFPFERFNYVIQNMPTNSIFGELEVTLFHKFCCAQRLRSFFVVDSLSTTLKSLTSAFHRIFKNDGRGTHLNDILAHSELFQNSEVPTSSHPSSSLSKSTRRLLSEWIRGNDELMAANAHIRQQAIRHVQLQRFGQTFTTTDNSACDSHIMLQDGDTDWRAANIQQLFTHTRTRIDESVVTQTFAVIERYRLVRHTDGSTNTYDRYAYGRLFFNDLEKEHVIVEFSSIKAHVVSCVVRQLDQEYLLVLPLNKVRCLV